MRTQARQTCLVITLALLLWAATGGVTLADQPNSKAEREQLQQQLLEIEQQIAQYEKELAVTKSEKNTLANKISSLKTQQAAIRLQIQATTIKLISLATQQTQTEMSIVEQVNRIVSLREQLSKFILLIQYQDDIPLWPRLITSHTISDAFSEYQEYVQVLEGLQTILGQVTAAKHQLETNRQVLAEQQDAAHNLLSIKTLQQQKLVDTVKQQDTLLQQTKGREANYQTILKTAQQSAKQIRGRIYQLLDVSTQITFGQALEIAQWVSQQTGVRPAFLLAVLTQESNLGRNVGTCNRLDDPPAKHWQVIMKPERDHAPFLAITKELGMDPDVTPVSCPMRDKNGQQIGWGGAMGPAQFIPSTWQGYKAKVSALTGKTPANPWDIRDAFVASAIKLKADGANNTRQGEWNAAMRYFSGSTNPQYKFYGDSVLALADGYQDDIDELSK